MRRATMYHPEYSLYRTIGFLAMTWATRRPKGSMPVCGSQGTMQVVNVDAFNTGLVMAAPLTSKVTRRKIIPPHSLVESSHPLTGAVES